MRAIFLYREWILVFFLTVGSLAGRSTTQRTRLLGITPEGSVAS